ncbi:SIR2 family protein [Flammeovirga kamogawensis]|uniref:SIR2 family protein n=1 Tax=Flammeovirga kamogawensis TaxID=373891 RepID=A0ABX8H010_9BACT|nr:SIR2 family protein [Flammeovirga kamogawensis]
MFKGISFTEFYDAIDIQNTTKKNFSATIQKDVKNTMSLWKHNDEQNIILNKICALNAPILTTNFDDLIPKSAQLKPFKIPYKGFTDYYPWNCYFSNKKLNNPIDGFGVWYLNGMIKYHRSIKLGLSQYMGNVERVRKMMYKNRGVIGKEDKLAKKWNGYPTWLHIIFNKSLCIIGLGLEENEVFFRWLLIERAKYFKAFPSQKKDGWYITVKKEDDSFLGKKFFLESVGIKVLEVDNYETIYKHIWQ